MWKEIADVVFRRMDKLQPKPPPPPRNCRIAAIVHIDKIVDIFKVWKIEKGFYVCYTEVNFFNQSVPQLISSIVYCIIFFVDIK